MTEGTRIGTHIALRVSEGEGDIAVSVRTADCIETVSRRHDYVDFPLLGRLHIMVDKKCERSMSNGVHARNVKDQCEMRRMTEIDLAKGVLSDLELKRQNAAAYGSNEVSMFICHGLRMIMGSSP